MTVARQTLNGPEHDDILPFDWVRIIGQRGVGLVESVSTDTAVVCFSPGRREILPVKALRRVKQRGSLYDTRRWSE